MINGVAHVRVKILDKLFIFVMLYIYMNNSNGTTLDMLAMERVARDDMGRTIDTGEMLHHKMATLQWEIFHHKTMTYEQETLLGEHCDVPW